VPIPTVSVARGNIDGDKLDRGIAEEKDAEWLAEWLALTDRELEISEPVS
jgi:hypothetical protein